MNETNEMNEINEIDLLIESKRQERDVLFLEFSKCFEKCQESISDFSIEPIKNKTLNCKNVSHIHRNQDECIHLDLYITRKLTISCERESKVYTESSFNRYHIEFYIHLNESEKNYICSIPNPGVVKASVSS